MRFSLFIVVLLYSALSFSRNKIVYTVAPLDPKKLPDLYVLLDYKKGVNSKRFIESEVLGFANTEEFIVYINKDRKLFLIKEFDSLTKNLIAEKVSGLRIKDGRLFYETVSDAGIKTLWSIPDLQNLRPTDLLQGYLSHSLDE